MGEYEGDVVAANILGEPREANYDAVPRVTYTDPHAAGVGAAEAPFTATYAVRDVPKAAASTRAYADSTGFLTLLSDGHARRLRPRPRRHGLASGGRWIAVTLATRQWWPGQEYLCLSRVFAAYSVGGLLGPAFGSFAGVRVPFTPYLALLLHGFAVLATLGPGER